MKTIKALKKRMILVILDGFGINPNSKKNAIQAARKPFIDNLFSHYPFTTIQAGGELVGLPKGVAGNSEVGHLNLGAGSPVRQDLVRINEAIKNKTLESMNGLNDLINHSRLSTKRIHLMGLLSDGNVHSHINHIKEIIKILSKQSDLQIFFHAFMDGRDTNQKDGIKYIQDLLSVPGFTFASMQGRSIGMDRDRRWEKIELCYKTITGRGFITNKKPEDYIIEEYNQGIYDEFIKPVLFSADYAIKNNDSIFFLNFRPDRARELTLAFMDKNFKEFKTDIHPSFYLCMSPYVPEEVSLPILFDKEKIPGTLSEYLSKIGLNQLKIAETEKYAHVTYFFNGGEEKPFPGEKRILVQSPKEVATYDQKPQMSAFEVTDKLMAEIDDKSISVFVVNYANSDMVGHTGNFEAAVKAIEALDQCLEKLVSKAFALDMGIILTADHGNSDQMIYDDGSPHTSHTDAPVPFCIIAKELKDLPLTPKPGEFALRDVAPTLLYTLGIEKPINMQGTNIYE